MFGLVGVDSVEIRHPSKDIKATHVTSGSTAGFHAAAIVENVGMFLFALYHVAIIVILINMLIAMMSHSFEAIQVRTYLEPNIVKPTRA
jgi:Ion transport protein